MRTLIVLSACLALLGCSTTDQTKAANTVTTPLSDLNLVKADVPAVLQNALRAPYALPADTSCIALAQAVDALDEVLGPDIDAPASVGERGLMERGAEQVSEAAVGAVQRTAEGLIPFRGWVRKLSGAERHAKKVQAAITAGGVRRAFLKGLRAAQTCPA